METVTKLSSSQSFKTKKGKVLSGEGWWWGLGCSSTVRSRFSKSLSFLTEGETFIVFFFFCEFWFANSCFCFFFLFLFITTPTLAASKNDNVTIEYIKTHTSRWTHCSSCFQGLLKCPVVCNQWGTHNNNREDLACSCSLAWPWGPNEICSNLFSCKQVASAPPVGRRRLRLLE